jgi:hypothetical protein
MLFLRGGGASRSESSSDFVAVRRWCRSFCWVKPLVAVVLLVAAALKAHELATVPVVGSGLLESRWFLVAVVQYELFLAVWLLSGLFAGTAWWITIGTFGLFAVVSASKALAGDPTCGCFGRVPTSHWLSLSINMAAIPGLVGERIMARKCTTPAGNTRGLDGSNAAYQWLGTAWLVAAVALVVVTVNERASADLPGIGTRVGDFVLVEPERMLDGPFALGEHIDIGDRLASGRWLVVLYRPDCPTCQSLLEELTAIQLEWNERAQIAWVCVGTAPSPKQSLDLTETHTKWLRGTISEQFNWFVTVPLLIALDENQVLAASSPDEGSFHDLVNGAWAQGFQH